MMDWPILPFSREALSVALNGTCVWMLMREGLRPSFRGWYSVFIVTMFCMNVVITAVNLASWLGLLRN